MSGKIHLLSGINTWGTQKSMGLIAEKLFKVGFKKDEVITHHYGIPIIVPFAWLRDPFIARRIAKDIEPGDIVIGHSNGAAIAWLMAKYGAPIRGAILLNPALDADKAMSQQVEWVHVFHNTCDKVVSWAKWIPFHIWGDQGRRGYLGNDTRYLNHNIECHEKDPIVEHSFVLNDPVWAEIVARTALEEMKPGR